MNAIILVSIEAAGNRVDYRFRVEGRIREYFQPECRLFLHYNEAVDGLPESILSIPFAANVMPLAWLTDARVVVRQLDKSFHDCLEPIKAAYQTMFPHYPFGGELQCGETVENVYTPEHDAASLFSGGLDALTTYVRIRAQRPLLITEYGWHDGEIRHSDVWEADRAHAVAFAEKNGLRNLLVQSNYGTFIRAARIDRDYSGKLGDSWWHGLHHGLAIISAAIPAACLHKVRTLYIASSNTPAYPVPCASDPTVDNLIRYASGGVVHDGYELSRQDKVREVVRHYGAEGEGAAIRVCFRNRENCCRCEKCMRTILGIAAEGSDPRLYGFDVPERLSDHTRRFLAEEVKFFTDTFIAIYWTKIQDRMRQNSSRIADRELLTWFPDYDFAAQRRRALLKYRVTNFFPILKRKIAVRIDRLRPEPDR